jgi:hypothetical protein
MISLRKTLALLIVVLTVTSQNAWSDIPLGNTFTDWALYFFITLIFFLLIRSKRMQNEGGVALMLYLSWVVICIIRGCFVADGYWDWKNLITGSFALLIPISVYGFSNPVIVGTVLRYWTFLALPLFVVFIPFIDTGAYGFYLAPAMLLIAMAPMLKLRWKMILVCIALFVILANFGARTNVLKFAFALLLAIGYELGFLKKRIFVKIGSFLFLIIPFILLILGITGVFNPFKLDEITGEKVVIDSKSKLGDSDENLTADTRTFLYVEVLSSAVNNNYILSGRTPARGNDSEHFGGHMAEELKTGRWERYSNEVGILNIFTWTGLIGVILYFGIFLRATYLAVSKSKNDIIPLLGLYVSFRWFISFVEDFNMFNIMNITLWMLISMCFSSEFRNMSNYSIKECLNGIFRNIMPKK